MSTRFYTGDFVVKKSTGSLGIVLDTSGDGAAQLLTVVFADGHRLYSQTYNEWRKTTLFMGFSVKAPNRVRYFDKIWEWQSFNIPRNLHLYKNTSGGISRLRYFSEAFLLNLEVVATIRYLDIVITKDGHKGAVTKIDPTRAPYEYFVQPHDSGQSPSWYAEHELTIEQPSLMTGAWISPVGGVGGGGGGGGGSGGAGGFGYITQSPAGVSDSISPAQSITEQRKRDGLCPTCGTKGHFDRSLSMICPVHGVY